VNRVDVGRRQRELGGGVEAATEEKYRRSISHARKDEEDLDVGEASRRSSRVVRITGLVAVVLESSAPQASRAEGIRT
jgi:hypothetical protein